MGSRDGMSKAMAEQLLDLSGDYTKADLDKAYRSMVKRHHPDVGGSADTMVRINAAKAYLDFFFAKDAGVFVSCSDTSAHDYHAYEEKYSGAENPYRARAAAQACPNYEADQSAAIRNSIADGWFVTGRGKLPFWWNPEARYAAVLTDELCGIWVGDVGVPFSYAISDSYDEWEKANKEAEACAGSTLRADMPDDEEVAAMWSRYEERMGNPDYNLTYSKWHEDDDALIKTEAGTIVVGDTMILSEKVVGEYEMGSWVGIAGVPFEYADTYNYGEWKKANEDASAYAKRKNSNVADRMQMAFLSKANKVRWTKWARPLSTVIGWVLAIAVSAPSFVQAVHANDGTSGLSSMLDGLFGGIGLMTEGLITLVAVLLLTCWVEGKLLELLGIGKSEYAACIERKRAVSEARKRGNAAADAVRDSYLHSEHPFFGVGNHARTVTAVNVSS